MGLTLPYGQNHYMGEYATEGAALTWIRDNKWDSAGNGTGNPQAGMAFFDTAAAKIKVHDGSAWVALGSATPAGSNQQIQFNNSGSFGASNHFLWDGTRVSVIGEGIELPAISGYAYGDNTAATIGVFRANGTLATPTAISAGYNLGVFQFNGYNGSAFGIGAAIQASAEQNWTGSVYDSRMTFYTAKGTAQVEQMRLTSDGKLGIKNVSPSALLTLGTAGTTAGTLSLAGATSGTCTIQVAAAAGTTTFQLPASNGTNGYFLQTNGSGVTTWAAASAIPAGSNTQVQYNNSGAFGASSGFTFDSTNRVVDIAGDAVNAGLRATSAGASAFPFLTFRRYRNTIASPQAVQSEDVIGQIAFVGYGATGAYTGAQFVGYADATWTDSSSPAYVLFRTTPSGTTTPSERMRITSAGHVYIGLTTAPTSGGSASLRKFIVSGDSTSVTGMALETGGDASRVECYRANNTLASKTAVVSGDILGTFNVYGWDGGTTPSYIVAAQIRGECDGTVAEDNVPGRFIFYTRNTSGTNAERMRLTSAGNLFIGTTAAYSVDGVTSNYTLQVSATESAPNYVGIAHEAAGFNARYHGLRCKGTLASKTAVAAEDVLVTFNGLGWDGGTTPTYVMAAGMTIIVDGTVAEDSVPARLSFWTRAVGSTSGTTERMRITNAGNVFIGTTAGVSVSGTTQTHNLIVYGTDSSPQLNGIISEGGACPGRFNGHRHNGTYGTKTAVATTQNLLGINAFGWDGGTTPTYVQAAAITFTVDGAVAEDSVPGSIIFYTREVGNTVSPYQRMVITNIGRVGIANNAPTALLTIGTNATVGGAIDLLGATSGTCTIQVAAAAGTTTFQLPATNGTSGQFLQTNGSGVTTWATVSGAPAGSNYQIQYYNGGAFGASSNFSWDGTSRVTLVGASTWCGNQNIVYSATASHYGYLGCYRFGGTVGTPLAVGNAYWLGIVSFNGAYDSTNTTSAWSLESLTTSAWSSGSTPSFLRLMGRSSSTNQYQVMRWEGTNVGIGTHTSLTERLDLQDGSGNGAIRIGNTGNNNAGTIKYTGGTFSGYNGSSWVNFGGGSPAGSTGYVQFNTGGAFDAESTLFWDKANDRLGIGTATPAVSLDVRSAAEAHQILLTSVTSTAGSVLGLYKSRGTLTVPTATQSGDTLGTLYFDGYGTTWINTATITAVAREAFTASTGKTDLVIRATSTGAAISSEVARFHGNGLHIGAGAATVEWPLYVSKDAWFPEVAAIAHSATASHGGTYYAGHTRGTRSAPTATQSGDLLGGYQWIGYGTSTWVVPAAIQAYADQAYTNSTAATHLRFLVAPSGSVSATERMRIAADGKIRLGGTYALTWDVQMTRVGYSQFASMAVSNTAAEHGLLIVGRGRGTDDASPSAVSSGDSLGSIVFCGYETGYRGVAWITSLAAQSFSSGNWGTHVTFSTTASGSATLVERMRIVASGGVSIGTTSTSYTVDAGTNVYQLVVSSSAADGIRGNVFVESGADVSRLFLARCNGTVASKTAVTSGDGLGSVNFNGWDGAKYVTAAQVYALIENTVSTGIVPTALRFITMNTSGTLAERMRVTNAGLVGIANTSPSALLTLGTAGTTAGSLSLAGATSGTCTIQVAAAAGTTTFQLPASNGTSGQFLQTNGSGVTTWATVSGGTTVDAGTAQGQVLFWNNGGSAWTHTETSEWFWDDTNKWVGIGCTTPTTLLTLGTAGTTAGKITLAGATSGTCVIQVAAAAGTGTIFQLPATNGTNGYFLKTDGSGATSWAVATTTALDAGTAAGQVLFWDHGNSKWTYAETSEWVWDDTNKRVGINVAAPSSRLDVGGDVEIASDAWHYYGDPTTDGSWRTGRVSADLVVQKRESGTWTTKHTFA